MTPRPEAAFSEANPTFGFNLADSEALNLRWNNHATPGAALCQVGLPQDLDESQPAVLEFLCSKSGATVGDATWDSHQNTPSVSDYPSTQSTFSAAAAVVLGSALGGDSATFTVTSGKPFEGITRSFTSFSQAARESADSRIYAGIHFRSACEDGLLLGRKVGERVAKLYLQPARP